MPRQVVELFACWLEGVEWQSSECSSAEGGSVLPFVVELKSFFFNTFYRGAVALDFPNWLGFHDFLDLFSLSSEVYLLYTSCIPGLCILRFLNNNSIIYQKKGRSQMEEQFYNTCTSQILFQLISKRSFSGSSDIKLK